MVHQLAVVVVFLFSFCTYADNNSLDELLINDWKPFITKLDRDIYTYHYVSKGTLLNVHFWKQDDILEYAERRTKAFTEKSKEDETQWLGDGLYLAQNPYIGGEYGDGFLSSTLGWLMLRVTLPKGMVAMDVRTHDDEDANLRNRKDLPVRMSTYRLLKARCPSLALNPIEQEGRDQIIGEEYYHFVDKKNLTRDEVCQKAVKKALRKLNVGVMIHRWHAADSVPGCRVQSGSKKAAFNTVNMKFTHQNTIAIENDGLEVNTVLVSDEKWRTYQEVDFVTRRYIEANASELIPKAIKSIWPEFGPTDVQNPEAIWEKYIGDQFHASNPMFYSKEEMLARFQNNHFGCNEEDKPAVTANGYGVHVIRRQIELATKNCDQYLSAYPAVCKLQSQYRDLKQKYSEQGVDIEQVVRYRALRFISEWKWDARKDLANYLPWHIYEEDAEKGWRMWENGNLYAQKLSREFGQNSFPTHTEIKEINGHAITSDLMTIWATWLKGNRPGYYRYEAVSGLPIAPKFPVYCEDLLTPTKINLINNFDLQTSDHSGPIVTASLEKCPGDNPVSVEGIVHYLPTRKVQHEMNLWLEFAQKFWPVVAQGGELKKLSTPLADYMQWQYPEYLDNLEKISPVEFIADVQRWFVSIHPFGDGNGRSSRFIQDFMIGALELPYPLSGRLQDDVFIAKTDYREQMLESMQAQIPFLQSCLTEYQLSKSNPSYKIDKDCLPLNQIWPKQDEPEAQAEKRRFWQD